MEIAAPLTNEQLEILQQAFQLFKIAIRNGTSQKVKEWLSNRRLTEVCSEAGFIANRFLDNRDREYKNQMAKVGLYKIRERKNERRLFGKNSIVFPLKDKENRITNLLAIHLKNGSKEFLNDSGIYPHYPPAETEVLILTKTTLDAATLMEHKVIGKKEAVIALHEGELKEQHLQAIQSLKSLRKIFVIG